MAGARSGAIAAYVPAQIPGTLVSQRNLLTVSFSIFSTIFGFQTSYKLGFHWLFTLFFRRLARCPSWVHEQVGSAPIYFVTIFQPP